MLEIDGSYGEGGGQIIRSALALAVLTNTDVKLTNIRANRPKPGLSFQHLTAVRSMAKLSDAAISELKLGIRTIEFKPGKVKPGRFNFDIGTAGSITLVLQACLPAILFGLDENKVEINIRGGTDVNWSPQLDYFRSVFLNHLRRIGVKTETQLISRGYYPKGGGEVNLKVFPSEDYTKLDINERGSLIDISGIAHSRQLPEHITKRMANAAKEQIKNYSISNIEQDVGSQNYSTGTGLVLLAQFENTVLGASALGKKGMPAEAVGKCAALELMDELKTQGTVDIYAADQLIPYLAMLGGSMSVRELSSHTETNIWLVEQFFDKKFHMEKAEGWVKIY